MRNLNVGEFLFFFCLCADGLLLFFGSPYGPFCPFGIKATLLIDIFLFDSGPLVRVILRLMGSVLGTSIRDIWQSSIESPHFSQAIQLSTVLSRKFSR
jgi:hypothetical protein